MKMLLPLALVFTVFAACTHDKAPEPTTASEPSAKEGWEDVKSGSKEIAKDAGTAVVEGAKDAGTAIKEGAKDAGQAIKEGTCPVVGNKTTKVFYTKANKGYKTALSGKKAIAFENRECFATEANAREAGYTSTAK